MLEQHRLRKRHQCRAEHALQDAEQHDFDDELARPQSIEATVKPATATRNRRFSPKRLARKPVGGVMIAAATI